jgi:uncharacterized membrane protein (DUF441 family)
LKDWKTTVAGMLTIIVTLAGAGLAYLHGQPINSAALIAGLTAGATGILASDSTK